MKTNIASLLQRFAPRRVVRLGADDRAAVAAHFLALPPADRQCRFGAGCSDTAVNQYVDRIDFARDLVLAVREGATVIAIAHVPMAEGVAELGVSVLPQARRRGVALALARRALILARRHGAREFQLGFASANEAMHRLALRLEMALERDGSGWMGRLPVPA